MFHAELAKIKINTYLIQTVMKKLASFLFIVFAACTIGYGQIYTSDPNIGTSSTGNIGIGTSAPSEYFHINPVGVSPYLRIERTGTPQQPYGGYGIKIGDAGSLSASHYPACGTGTFFIKGNKTNGNTISFNSSMIDFGTAPSRCSGGSGGTFNFGGGNVWINDKLVVSAYNFAGPTGFVPHTDYKFSVNGNSNFTDKVVIGSLKSFSPSPDFKLSVVGASNFNDKVVIGSYAAFTKGFPASCKLFVAGGIMTERVKVAIKSTTDWSDYVFEKDYKLMPLKDVEAFITKHAHLPNVPSARDVVDNGVDIAEMDAKLLEKIEELTLYIIEQNKRITELEAKVKRARR